MSGLVGVKVRLSQQCRCCGETVLVVGPGKWAAYRMLDLLELLRIRGMVVKT